ncbi:hypothetical protein BDZ90DRAFT_281614 [Jaminaea rosea]|uniref:F-box domain-containing protein n=1 Tax=Jaminaea rosea TaxID=1569628 RepID=A0A316UJD6_9BASI|nr:hypothetical protein BDZ90DRAFT_281614 [Jaminaea rosea]PWN25407.1 hypothetical protein BDZ90DRAFT_281614 [Jaminaea rosea]
MSSAHTSPWDRKLTSLSGFETLPSELKTYITQLACRLPPIRCRARRDASPTTVDKSTALSLALVSCDFYNIVIVELYKHIRITRPSALQMLVTTFTTRAALGKLVQSLFVGVEQHIDEDWWPLRIVTSPALQGQKQCRTVFRVSLGHQDSIRPSWCCPSHDFDLNEELNEELDNKDFVASPMRAVSAAIKAAAQGIGVSLLEAEADSTGNEIGSDAWHIQVLETCAAIELFLMRMRQCEDEQRNAKHDVDYPVLVITKPPMPKHSVNRSHRSFKVSHGEITERLAAPKTKYDRFDHPLLFARVGVPWAARGPDGQLHSGDGDEDAIVVAEGENLADVFSPRDRYESPSSDEPLVAINSASLSLDLPSFATIGGILSLVRSLLGFTPSLRTLSLTEFLELAVCGTQSPPALDRLQSRTL